MSGGTEIPLPNGTKCEILEEIESIPEPIGAW